MQNGAAHGPPRCISGPGLSSAELDLVEDRYAVGDLQLGLPDPATRAEVRGRAAFVLVLVLVLVFVLVLGGVVLVGVALVPAAARRRAAVLAAVAALALTAGGR